jgi:hypothetical protein
MAGQGCSTLPTADDGRVLDRLAGLEKVIPPELIRQALLETGCVNGRDCKITHELMMGIMLAMGLYTDLPIRQVFKMCRRFQEGEKSPGRSTLCEARQRLGVEPLIKLFSLVVRPLATVRTRGAFYRGLRLMAFDSTLMNVFDSEANAIFGRASSGRGEGAFPQVRKLSLVELGTRIETAIAVGNYGDCERTLARRLWDRIPDDALILEDRGFFCYSDWKDLNLRTKLLVRMKSTQILKPIQKLSDGSYLAKIYPDHHAREQDRDGIVVRVIAYTLDDPQRTGHGETHRLITNLLEEREYPAPELIPLYHERWEHELMYDEQKTHQDPVRAEKPAQLRSQTPAGVRQELYALSLAHFVIRSLMLSAAEAVDLDVDRVSFTGTLHILQNRLSECDGKSAPRIDHWFKNLISEISDERTDPRRNRVNPRVIKQKMSKWKKKQPHHRPVPRLTKAFEASVIIIS